MKKLIGFCGLLALVGCSTVEMSSTGSMDDGKRLLVIQAKSYQIARAVPLFSNGLTWDAEDNKVSRTPVFFSDEADTQHLYDMAKKIAQRENCNLGDVTFIDNYWALDPSLLYGLISSSDVAISAVLIPRQAKEVRK